MKYRVTSLTRIASLTGLLTALGCGGSSASDETDLNSEGSALTRGAGPAKSASAEEDADDEEENDKIVCTVDADCDADEVCANGLCSDPPGQADDDDGAVCEADDDSDVDDDHDDGEVDDEEENDKIVCTVDTDCDSDEVCTNGTCSDP